MLERKTRKPQIVVLNTDLMRKENDDAANRQWIWLEEVLTKFQSMKGTVRDRFKLVGFLPRLFTISRFT